MQMVLTFLAFLKSESGYVRSSKGLSLGWLAVAGLAVSLVGGQPQPVYASWDSVCDSLSPGGISGWYCNDSACGSYLWPFGRRHWEVKLQRPTEAPQCTIYDSRCPLWWEGCAW